VAAERNEVRRGEHQVVLADLYAEMALHDLSSVVPASL
jgi:hypothetical protein